MLCVSLLYFAVASTSFKGPDGQYSRKLIDGYWAWFRWAIIFSFVLQVMGIVSLFNALQGLYFMKFPDHHVEKHAVQPPATAQDSPLIYYNTLALWMLVGALLFMGILIPGFALRFKNLKGHEMALEHKRKSAEKSEIAVHLELFDELGQKYSKNFENACIEPFQLKALTPEQLCMIGLPLGHALKLVDQFRAEDATTDETAS